MFLGVPSFAFVMTFVWLKRRFARRSGRRPFQLRLSKFPSFTWTSRLHTFSWLLSLALLADETVWETWNCLLERVDQSESDLWVICGENFTHCDAEFTLNRQASLCTCYHDARAHRRATTWAACKVGACRRCALHLIKKCFKIQCDNVPTLIFMITLQQLSVQMLSCTVGCREVFFNTYFKHRCPPVHLGSPKFVWIVSFVSGVGDHIVDFSTELIQISSLQLAR